MPGLSHFTTVLDYYLTPSHHLPSPPSLPLLATTCSATHTRPRRRLY